MKLEIEAAVFDEMLQASREALPLEACGLLAGREQHSTKCYHLTNVDASPDHFSMKPEEQFAAVKDMRANGLEMLAIWHSHPATPARMSEEDIRLAYTPDAGYVILSLAGATPVVRCFTMAGDQPAEVTVEIEKDTP